MPLYKNSWTPINDGAGSGLDADLLDGNEATAFAATGQTMHIGTTAVPINRTSGNLALTGITSIDGNAATVTNGVYTTRSVSTTSPVTGGGDLSANRTIALESGYGDTQNPYNSKTANFVLAAPNGTAGVPTFRALTPSDVGLSNVNNTSDANKPVSTATQTALNAKQDTLVSGTTIKTVGGQTLLGSGDVAVSGFPTGTVMLFVQTAAPTGWTKMTTHNDKALRVVSGIASSGGTTAFTSVFASRTPAGSVSTSTGNTTATGSVSTSTGNTTDTGTVGATTLATTQIPSHSHTMNAGVNTGLTTGATQINVNSGNVASGSTGGGTSHTHSLTMTAHNHTATSTFTGTAHNHTASSSFTGTAMDFAVQYVDVILASKD